MDASGLLLGLAFGLVLVSSSDISIADNDNRDKRLIVTTTGSVVVRFSA